MDFVPRDRAVYLPSADVLVLADLHVGRDAASNVHARLGEHEDLTERFEALLAHYGPAEAVIAGDLLHSFDALPTGTAQTVHELRDIAAEADCRVVVTPGNHDSMLGELWEGSTPDEYRPSGADTVITHGHEPPEADADCYVVGHDHPTIDIEGQRHPCYLYGTEQYDTADVLMLPAFSRVPAGMRINDMSASDFQSPLIKRVNAFRPIVRDEVADETHEFPPLGEFRRHL
ncbi:metallophosphoesterase [Natronomonas halophila]|uniref:metallophosphoesterase n=1 Tax=Natronomonas halophila TaxID=2747817 RepID=UPI0015B384AF|nr:metallophosphoesterase [Natronomonas halophila]QLD86645.1 metallophosphoesterase [Natronomonas halophila]